MFLARPDDNLRVADLLDLLRENVAELLAHFGRNATSPAVGHDSFRIHRAEVRARTDIARLKINSKPQRLDHPAAHLKLQRIIAKQSQVPRTAARSDARCHGNHPALRRVLRQGVQVRRVRSFKRGAGIRSASRDVTQSIEDDERELGVGFDEQFGVEGVEVHG